MTLLFENELIENINTRKVNLPDGRRIDLTLVGVESQCGGSVVAIEYRPRTAWETLLLGEGMMLGNHFEYNIPAGQSVQIGDTDLFVQGA
jgi:hypothetical protein